MEYILQLWCPQFLAGQQTKYGYELLDIRCGMLAEWSEPMRKVVKHNWVINPWNKRGKNLGLDEFMEEVVRAIKDQYNPGNAEHIEWYSRQTLARCIVYFMGIKDDIRQGLGLRRRSGNHSRKDKRPDVQALMVSLLEEGFGKVSGRGKPTLEMPNGLAECPDLMGQGLERMVNGAFWRKYLLRSPGCALKLQSINILGNGGEEDIDSESDEDVI